MAKYIPLTSWAARLYDPIPSLHTLRAWCRLDRIQPPPQKVGREYRVREDAAYVSPSRPLQLPRATVLQSEDPIVRAILNGQAP